MAGDWIKMRVDLQTHPKVVRIMSACKADKYRVIGGLHAVWSVFDAHTEAGELDGYSFELMDEIIGWPGFSSAMAAVGWLVVNGETLVSPEFDTHNGKSAKRRCMEAERKRSSRKASADDADKMRTREEKRREEVNLPSANAEGVGSTLPPCPHQEIISLYHEALPACTAVREWTPARQALLRSRWAENGKRQTLGWWKRFFDYVAESEFLTGRGSCGPDRDPFVADLEWLVRPKNFVKVIEGKYHKGAV